MTARGIAEATAALTDTAAADMALQAAPQADRGGHLRLSSVIVEIGRQKSGRGGAV